jgi:hypothetical protein
MYPTALVNHWIDVPVPPEPPVPSVPTLNIGRIDIERTGTSQDLFDWVVIDFLAVRPLRGQITGILLQLRMNWIGQSYPYIVSLEYTDDHGNLIDYPFTHSLEAGSRNPVHIVASAQVECLAVSSDDTNGYSKPSYMEVHRIEDVFGLGSVRIRCTDSYGTGVVTNLTGFEIHASGSPIVPALLPQLRSNSD